MASLDSPLIKFNRAGEHVDTLEAQLFPLEDLKSYVIACDIDDKTGEQICRFENVPPMPPKIEVVFGEMLYNFRCSLDHLVWQLVLSEGNTPSTRNEFPIFENPSRYEAEKPVKLQGVSPTVIPIIDALQPCYSTGPNDYWWYLWYLHVLNNADKHRHLLLTRQDLGNIIRVSGSFGGRTPKAVYLDVPIEKGAVFFRGEPNVDMNVQPRIAVVFSNAPSDIRTDLSITTIARNIYVSVDEVFRRLRSHVK